MMSRKHPQGVPDIGEFVNRAYSLPHVHRNDRLGISARSSPIPLFKTGNKARTHSGIRDRRIARTLDDGAKIDNHAVAQQAASNSFIARTLTDQNRARCRSVANC